MEMGFVIAHYYGTLEVGELCPVPRRRTHVVLPDDLLAEVDALVGPRGRSAFLTEVIQREIRRRKLLAAVRDARGSWKTEDHPELEGGSEVFVDGLRAENEARLKNLPEA